MYWQRQFFKIALILLSVIIIGVGGFVFVEGWGFLDALYMTLITISTVGFNEVHPITPSGKVFVIGLIMLGVGTFFYIITSLAEFVVSGQFGGALGRKRMKKAIDSLKNHYIICGFGRVGQQVAMELKREGVPFVVIDDSPDSIQRCIGEGYLYIEGDASNDDALKEAGIFRAKGLVTATDSDADNVYIALSARALNKDLNVVARANLAKSEYKLLKAGADRVISPYSIGGRRLASLLLRPAVVDFLDVVMHGAEIELIMEEVFVHDRSVFAGMTMGEAREKSLRSANILAIKKKDGERVMANPPEAMEIERGDRLIALGTRAQLKELEGLA
ncbi:MAG: potassium channel family protein [Thermodesulfobacteriota bacterium]